MMKTASRYAGYALAALLALGVAAPVLADWHDDHDHEWRDDHDREWREHERHEREWREHEYREHYYAPPPVVYAPAPRAYYPPPPLVIGVPGLNIIVH